MRNVFGQRIIKINLEFSKIVRTNVCDNTFLTFQISNSIVNSIIFLGSNNTKYLQSVTKIMGKTGIRAISCFYLLPLLTMLRNNEQNLRQAVLWERNTV